MIPLKTLNSSAKFLNISILSNKDCDLIPIQNFFNK